MADENIDDLSTAAENIDDLSTPAGAMPPAAQAAPPGSSLGPFNEGMLNELFASAQGTSPITRSLTGEQHYRPLGVLLTEETELGPANTVIQSGPDQFVNFDPESHVVFSEGGRLNVFQRSPSMEEGRASRLGRLLGVGLLAPNRASVVTGGISDLERGVRQLEASGVSPTVPLASQGTGAARMAQIAKAVPFAGEPIERGIARTRTEIEQAAGDVVAQYGRGAGAEEAGEGLREAGANWLTEWRKQGAQLDKDLADDFAKAGIDRIDLKNFARAVDSPFEEFDNPELAKQFSDEWFEQWRNVLKQSNGQVSINDMKGIRRRLGKMLEKPMIVNDKDRAQVEALYGAISEDLRAAAKAGGGDELLNKVLDRNAYWTDGFDRIRKSMKHVLNEQVNAESVFERVMGATAGKGGRANMRFLRDIRNSVGDEVWNDLASSVLVRMGRAPGSAQGVDSVFNPMTFLTNYRNMGKDAKKILFSGHEQAARNLDNLTTNVMPALQRVERLANVSRSGEVMTGAGLATLGAMGAYTGDIMQVLGAIGTAAGANVLARTMMNPRFTKWLARTSTAAKNATALDQQFWSRQLPRLRTLVSANPELQTALDVFEQKASEAR